LVEVAPIIEGKPDVTKITEIDLDSLGKRYRKQRLIFEATLEIFEQMQPTWKGRKEILLSQLTKIVEDFIDSNKIVIKSKFFQEDFRKRLLIMLNMRKIVQHLFTAIRFENTQTVVPIYDKEMPIKSTSRMMTWYTSRPCEITKKISYQSCGGRQYVGGLSHLRWRETRRLYRGSKTTTSDLPLSTSTTE
jgi:type III restriction enzyme